MDIMRKKILALVSAILSVNVFGLANDNFLGITIVLLLAFIYTSLNLLGNIVINDLVVSFSFKYSWLLVSQYKFS